ncbi:no significant blast hit, nitrosative stress-induced transcript [Histoplasma capsulatum var. duboisii H88]|nr:no significant blast hit, nitrosative stress-induced transcript [Histoplasma capsulatum var. duboisii H88]
MLFAVGWASSLFDDPDDSTLLTVKSAADYLFVYLDMEGWAYLEFEYLRLCLERYGFDPDLEFYHWLNRMYFRRYGIAYVVRSVPYS